MDNKPIKKITCKLSICQRIQIIYNCIFHKYIIKDIDSNYNDISELENQIYELENYVHELDVRLDKLENK